MVKKTKRVQRATSSGNLLEQTVKTICRQKGFKIEKYKDWKKKPEKYGNELLLTDVPYDTIYKHTGKTEFLLKSSRYNLEIRIECKWQQVSGSVDEKLPYLYLNSIEAMPEKHIVIVIDGKGWKTGAIPWLKEAAANRLYTTSASTGKKIEILSLTEFMAWANEVLR
ncbi:MAG: 4-diphosphocytidyl-2C-methyl-D-erythritol kinase [Bacteroidetes bacterium]|nr:4-diphosphocytidyl-2C-methyl-D-erythritol kinase [Bacteroidota bacterium]MBU2586272.1 4-diphosphocytidyl-2C-methyl-D-erythritol kinase [Bacteroidota bacterium]